jgi:hypothetical protein
MVGGLAMVVAGAGPVGAKGPVEVTITFPGGGPPVELLGNEHEGTSAVGRLTEDLGLWSAFGDGEVPPLTTEPPAEPVGEPFIVRWTMYEGSGKPIVVSQQLYIEPPGGGLVHTEAGQHAGPYSISGETTGGWFRAPADLSATFAAAGFKWSAPMPEVAPGATGTAAGAAQPERGGSPTVVIDNGTEDASAGPSLAERLGVAALAVGAGLGAAGLAVRRARRGRRRGDAAPAAG